MVLPGSFTSIVFWQKLSTAKNYSHRWKVMLAILLPNFTSVYEISWKKKFLFFNYNWNEFQVVDFDSTVLCISCTPLPTKLNQLCNGFDEMRSPNRTCVYNCEYRHAYHIDCSSCFGVLAFHFFFISMSAVNCTISSINIRLDGGKKMKCAKRLMNWTFNDICVDLSFMFLLPRPNPIHKAGKKWSDKK